MTNTTGRKILYDGKPVQVDSAIRDSTGLVINATYAKKTEVGVQLIDTSATFNLQSVPDFPEYPYRAEITNSYITEDTYVTVTFSNEQATSGNFAPNCTTASGKLYLYAISGGTYTIPTINLGGGPSQFTIDAVPTDGSDNAVSSNGVYDAIHQSRISLNDVEVEFILQNPPDYADFPYRATLTSAYITDDTMVEVTYNEAQSMSGDYAPFCASGLVSDVGTLYLYASSNVGTVTIPYIYISQSGGFANVVDAVQDGNYYPVTSNAVYDELGNYVTLGTEQDITASKYFKNTATYSSGTQYSRAIQFKTDNSGNVVGRINAKRTGATTGAMFIECLNPNTSEWKTSLELSTDGSESWGQLYGTRTYNASNTNDIVTIGMLQTPLGETFGKRLIRGSNYSTYNDFYNAIIAIEGKPFIVKYFDTPGSDFYMLSGCCDTFAIFGVSGTIYVSSTYYIPQRIQIGTSIVLFTINSGFTETALTLDYTKMKIYY